MAHRSRTTGIDIHDVALTDLVLDQACGIGDTSEPADRPGADPVGLLTAVRDLLGARSRTELCMRAVRAYLVHERRAACTARALFIHPNTLRYRLDHIRENLDLDLDDPDARFELLAALQLESTLSSLRPDGDNSASRLGRLTRPPREGGSVVT